MHSFKIQYARIDGKYLRQAKRSSPDNFSTHSMLSVMKDQIHLTGLSRVCIWLVAKNYSQPINGIKGIKISKLLG